MKAIHHNTLLVFLFSLFALSSSSLLAQNEVVAKVNVANPVNQLIEDEVSHKIPVITATQLQQFQNNQSELTILDTRVKDAYDLGHVQEARHLGSKFCQEKVWMLNRQALIIVHGDDLETSEEIGKQLLEIGFKNVHFLNGSLADLEQEGIVIEGDISKSDRKSSKYHRKNK